MDDPENVARSVLDDFVAELGLKIPSDMMDIAVKAAMACEVPRIRNENAGKAVMFCVYFYFFARFEVSSANRNLNAIIERLYAMRRSGILSVKMAAANHVRSNYPRTTVADVFNTIIAENPSWVDETKLPIINELMKDERMVTFLAENPVANAVAIIRYFNPSVKIKDVYSALKLPVAAAGRADTRIRKWLGRRIKVRKDGGPALGYGAKFMYRWMFLSILREPYTKSELQAYCEKYGVSMDTVNDNLKKLRRLEMLDITMVYRHGKRVESYSARQGNYCFGAMLVITTPFIIKPCMYCFQCSRDGSNCKTLDELGLIFGMNRDKVIIKATRYD